MCLPPDQSCAELSVTCTVRPGGRELGGGDIVQPVSVPMMPGIEDPLHPSMSTSSRFPSPPPPPSLPPSLPPSPLPPLSLPSPSPLSLPPPSLASLPPLPLPPLSLFLPSPSPLPPPPPSPLSLPSLPLPLPLSPLPLPLPLPLSLSLSLSPSLPPLSLSSESMKGVREWGLPQHRHTDIKGNLYIKFTVEFPESGFLPSEEDREVSGLPLHVHVHVVCIRLALWVSGSDPADASVDGSTTAHTSERAIYPWVDRVKVSVGPGVRLGGLAPTHPISPCEQVAVNDLYHRAGFKCVLCRLWFCYYSENAPQPAHMGICMHMCILQYRAQSLRKFCS